MVKNTVKLLSGTISVDSIRGEFTRLVMTLPLSVNVVDAFIIKASGHHLLLPMQHIVETRQVKESQIRTEAGRGTLRFNDEAILLVDQPDLMTLGTPCRPPVWNVIFVRYNEEMLTLRVTAILGRRRILLKPLPDSLKSMEFLSAVTIVDNGMPAFVLIITDVEMPGENGFEFTDRVRNHPKCSETPVIIMSSLGSDADIRKGIGVGANAYIVKGSFDQKVFIETVESLI